MQFRALFVVSTVVVTTLTSGSCNRRVFEEVKASCDRTIGDEIEVPTDKAADILIVVDNSGSMAEEQDELVDNFLNQDPAACPLQDLKNIPVEFLNPSRDLYTGGGALAGCGFIQLLAAFENDFNVGVITTDVGLCDNRIPAAQGGDEWGFRPQRGCLQPDGAPGTGGLRKVISAGDLKDDDNGNDDFAQRFRDTLENIQVFGSPFERGLDAMSIFLDKNAENRGPGCEGDLELFRRDDAALVVIFLTDEEDCSHGLGDGSFDNELEGEICGEFDAIVTDHNPADCYNKVDELPIPSLYVDQLLAADPNAKVAVIAGGLGEPGNVVPAGCTVGDNGAPDGNCFASGGVSNFNGPGANQPCGPDTADARGGLDCCLADPGSRYYEFANEVGKKTTDSICNASFRSTMLDIAAFIAAVDFVELPEEPASPSAIVVSLTRAGETESTTIQPLAAGADCATGDGWLIENGTRIVLCGEARPGPGDTIEVLAKGVAEEDCSAG